MSLNEALSPIDQPYLLVSGIPCIVDKEGRHYVDPLWHKDLTAHCNYINHLTLAAPCLYEEPPKGFVVLEDPSLYFVDLPHPKSTIKALLLLPKTLTILWRAIEKADVVHSGVGNWPIPYAWLVTPIAKWKGKFHLINIESAFWRAPPNASVSWKFKLREWISERLARCCMNAADLPLFTEEAYKKSLLTDPRKEGYVIQASWIDEDTILTQQQAETLWAKKIGERGLKLLFAGHLNRSKGIPWLLEAAQIASLRNLPITLDILGAGDLRADCEKLSHMLHGQTKVRLLGTVAYGKDFFTLLQNYHAVIIPSITDEQPRMAYDAYSQALPVLATRTTGLQECVEERRTGKLVTPQDALALADLMEWAQSNTAELQKMGINALADAHNLTHQKMHEKRWKLLLEHTKPR